jgi:hypothetical protein
MKRCLLSAFVAIAAAVCAGALVVPEAPADNGTTVTVMTRNLYLGTDLTPVLQASTQLGFVLAVASAFDEAQASDFAGRANAWADEIAVTRPDLVGLNEAVQWRTGPADGRALDATTNAGDFVQLLLSALAARGLHYQVAAESTGYDVEAPGLFPTGFMDVRLTQHEAILARTDEGLTLSNPQAHQYATSITVGSVVGSFSLPWSWASVDVTKNRRTFRFATTHLINLSGAAQVAQAQEFLQGPASTTLPMIFVGDLNSDADAAAVTGVVPDTETYGDVVAAGFRDSWAATRPGDPGYTCCEAEDLLNTTPTLDTRIDYVLTRGAIMPVGDVLVGNSILERLLFGRWPSDHAGVVAVLNVQSS